MGSEEQNQSGGEGSSVELAEGIGKKADGGKSPVWQGVRQYFPRALLAVGNISAYGAYKYDLSYNDINWLRVPDGFSRYSDALDRHLTGEFIDGPVDPESGNLHAAMAAWNSLARLELLLREQEGINDSK